MQWYKQRALLAGLALSLAYGIVAYLSFHRLHAMPTLAFLGALPAVIGAVPALFTDHDQVPPYVRLVLVPWFSVLALFLIGFAAQLEPLLCLLILAAPFWGFALLGALVMWLSRARAMRKAKRARAIVLGMLLPFAVLALEQQVPISARRVAIRSSIEVRAPAHLVFAELAEVRSISDAELPGGWSHRLGMPRPLRATVDRAALHGRRIGQFEGGLRFNETITEFDPPRRMAFDIAVDASSLRPGTSEEHALREGYFQFVDATYQVRPLSPSRVELALSSRYVLRSLVDAYGNLFAQALVGDFQQQLLAVLARRAERAAHAKHELLSRATPGNEPLVR